MARIEIKREESEAAGEKQPEVFLEELVGGPVRLQQEVLGASQEGGGHSLRKKVGNIFLASTILAGAMAGMAKKAEAGPHLGWAVERSADEAMRRGAEGLGKGVSDTVERIFGGGKTAREREDLERQKINQRNEAFRFGMETIREDTRTKKDLAVNKIRSNEEQIKKYQDKKIEARDKWLRGEISDAMKDKIIREYNEEIQNIKTGSVGRPVPQPQHQPQPERPPAPPAGAFERNPSPAVPSKEVPPQKPRRESAPGPETRQEKAATTMARVQGEDGRVREGLIPLPPEGQKFSPNVLAVEEKYAHLLFNSKPVSPEPRNW